MAAVSAVVWLGIPGPARAPSAGSSPASSTTTTALAPTTVYGCAIDAAGVADPDCTDASIVAEYCSVPRQSITTPGLEDRSDTSLTRTYQTGAGLPAGSVTHFDAGAGLPGYPLTLQCATGRTFGFSASDAESFTHPT